MPRSLPSSWGLVPLSEIATVVLGGTPSTDVPEYWSPKEVDWVTAKDISNSPVAQIHETERKISRVGLDRSNAKLLPPLTTVIIARGATTGRVRMLGRKMAINQTCYGIVAKGETDPRYIYYRFVNLYDHLRNVTHGTVFDTITTDTLHSLRIPLPPLAEQRAIAHILGSLDDKIDLNRRMNRTLEEIARALFRSWFVDFDPVHAHARGEAMPGLDPALDALFPAAFEDSALGPIPVGWRVGTVGEGFHVTMGQSPPGSTYNEEGDGLPFFQGRRDFGDRFPNRRVYCTAPTRLAAVGDTLVSVRAPVGSLNMADDTLCIGRGLAAVRHITSSRSYTYYSMMFLADEFNRFEGEGTVFGSINQRDFLGIVIVHPPEKIVVEFERIVAPLDEMYTNNHRESRTLAALRDTLLPKLMSGELRVAAAAEIAEAAA